ncbi:hypothetical protein [Dehalobacterium formicoaceticum]|uniref:Uncharacterized protein n=1 Tax=Dehalobacterium formicoaceticum TaxID=51515 RepID=A0ABT1Y4F1_9FIRM|nr:hypothetical protein [Dehalobacterium formicoaceticum]MCR6544556.1 hypothetical protein [Dehalobacterium formicoaceticum]
MSFWAVMNWVAWGLCGVLFTWIAVDFVIVERNRFKEKKSKN